MGHRASTSVVRIPEKQELSIRINPSQLADINTPIVYWPMVESSFGIVGACLPTFRPLFAGASTSGKSRIESPEVALVEIKQPAADVIHSGPERV